MVVVLWHSSEIQTYQWHQRKAARKNYCGFWHFSKLSLSAWKFNKIGFKTNWRGWRVGTGRLVLIDLPLQRNSWTSVYKCVVLPVLLWRKKTGNKGETTQHTPSSLSDRPLKNSTEPPATHTYSYCSLPQCVFINRVHPQTILKQKNIPCHSTLGTIFAPNTKTRI